MVNKILVKLYVPIIEEQYDAWIPLNRKVGNVINLLIKSINEFTYGYYTPSHFPMLYDKTTSIQYDTNVTIKESGMKNGTELILL